MNLVRFLDRLRDPTIPEEPSPIIPPKADEVATEGTVSEYMKDWAESPIVKNGRQLRALDLCCCGGGAALGLKRASFHVTGVDIEDQPNYLGDRFIQADALEFLRQGLADGSLADYALIWCSPPCKHFTELGRSFKIKKHDVDLITPTRPLLVASGRPWVIENVPNARKALRSPVVLCGTMAMFSGRLETPTHELRRHRLFESNFPVGPIPLCRHGYSGKRTGGIYGGHGRDRQRPGADAPNPEHRSGSNLSREDQFALMGVPCGSITLNELSEAIPPLYSEFIAGRFLEQAGLTAPELVTVSTVESVTIESPTRPIAAPPTAMKREAARVSASVVTLAAEPQLEILPAPEPPAMLQVDGVECVYCEDRAEAEALIREMIADASPRPVALDIETRARGGRRPRSAPLAYSHPPALWRQGALRRHRRIQDRPEHSP
jgi:DNA (cytosine-5)-methyltransferase 1